MSNSIKKNFVFNLINTVSALVFPLITFPYATRILLADGIGQVQFFQSIINYIILLTSVGIPLYGIKEIARSRDSKEDLSKTTIELLSLSLLFSIIGYIIVAVLCCAVGKIQDNIPLFLILSSSILLNAVGCPWFYSGIEDFSYITILNLIVKLVCVVFLITVVKTRDDLLLYGVYAVLGSVGNYLVNFARLGKYISFKDFSIKQLDCTRHIKPALSVFVFNLVTSIYINLDSVMLGFLSDSTSVGYYTGASKISHILVILVTSLGTVLLPRTSNLLKNGKTEEFFSLSSKSYNFILMMSYPMICGVILLSPSLIFLFCGNDFSPSITALRIICPIILFIGVSNLIGIQMLYPLGKMKLVTMSTCVGAVVNVTLNTLLIPTYAQNGAAIATVVAELSVAITQIFMVRRWVPFSLFPKKSILFIVASTVMAAVCYGMLSLLNSDILRVILIPIVGAFVYACLMVLFREELTIELINQVRVKALKNNE